VTEESSLPMQLEYFPAVRSEHLIKAAMWLKPKVLHRMKEANLKK
jgi:hypothetical protein